MATDDLIRESDVTPEFVAQLLLEYPDLKHAAKAIAERCRGYRDQKPAWRTVYQWLTFANSERKEATAASQETPTAFQQGGKPIAFSSTHLERLSRIDELFQKANVPIEAVEAMGKVRLKGYGVMAKVVDPVTGKEMMQTKSLHSTTVEFEPVWKPPKWPLIQPAAPIRVTYKPPTIIVPREIRTHAVLPDTQTGFLRRLDVEGEFLPMHDPLAMDVAVQVVAAVQPDEIDHLGDGLDMSEMSRWLQVDEFFRTTQPAINYHYAWLKRLEAVAGTGKSIRLRGRLKKRPRRRTKYVPGNHERRLSEYVQTNARAAFRLRPAMATPETWPDLSLPHLLRFDELGIEYMGEWPGGEIWIVEGGDHALVVVHDPQKRNSYYANVIAGHSHHRRQDVFTVRTPSGMKAFTLDEIGCLCSLDRNPDKLSLQRTRVPSNVGYIKNWVQGIAIVEVFEDTGQHHLDFIPIDKGLALYRGQVFQGVAE